MAWRFPLVIVGFVVVMGVAGISGSSVGIYGQNRGTDDPIAGKPRAVRTDEYWTRTPLVARAVTLGFPDRDRVGVGTTDMGVVSQLPTDGLGLVLLPYTAPYHVVGLDTAFALEWWILVLALPALGLYALLLALGVRIPVATAASLILVFSPALQWWTMPPVGGVIGFATLAGASFLWACRASSWTGRVAFALVTGWLGACLVAVLYPPWIVPISLAVAAVTIASLVTRGPEGTRRARVVALVAVVGIAGVVAGGLLVAFVVQHGDAIRAIADTVYPGQRRTRGGSAGLGTFFVAQYDILASTRPGSVPIVNGHAHFEATGLPLLLVVGAAVVVGPYRPMLRRWRDTLPLGAVLVVGALLTGWYLLPLPSIAGRLLLLDRVPPIRLALPLAFVGVLALALLVESERRASTFPRRRVVAGVAVFVAGALWRGRHLVIDGSVVPWWKILAIVACFAVGIGLAVWGRTAGLVVLTVLLGIAAAFVNPVQHGLGVLTDSPSAELGRTLRDRPGVGRVLMLSDDPGPRVINARGGLTASGVELISGVNLYPDRDAWAVLDPDGTYERAWNRFNNASWGAAPAGSPPRVELDQKDAILVFVDPCDPRLARLGVTTVVSLKRVDRPCLVPTDRVRDEPGRFLRVYRIDRSAAAVPSPALPAPTPGPGGSATQSQ